MASNFGTKLTQSLADCFGVQSTKRYVMQASAYALILITLAIGSACAFWIAKTGNLGMGAVGALSFIAGVTATLAGVAYRKPETMDKEIKP